MQSRLCRLLLLIGLYILFSRSNIVSAAVLLNEILPNPSGESSEHSEWVEIFNSSDNTVDLTGWILDDIEGGSAPYVLPSGTIIGSSGFLVFEKSVTDIALNNNGDSVRLISDAGTLADSYSYTNTEEDFTFGRSRDGDGIWVRCTGHTKNTTNGNTCPEPTPTPSPTLSPSPSPTHTPVPTDIPETTATPTTLATPTIRKSPTPRSSKIPTPEPVYLTEEESLRKLITPEASPTALTDKGGIQTVLPAVITLSFTGAGLGFLSLYYLWKKRDALKIRESEITLQFDHEIH